MVRSRTTPIVLVAFSGYIPHVVDLELMAAPAGLHEDGAGRTADAAGESKAGEHAPEQIMIKCHSCGEALRQNAERAGNPVDCRDTRRSFRRQDLARAHRRASGSAALAAAVEADSRPGYETAREGLRRRERSANQNKCQNSLRTITGIVISLIYTS